MKKYTFKDEPIGTFATKTKWLILLFLLISTFFVCNKATAQFYVGLGTGVSVTKGKPIGELQIGYADNSNIVLQGGFQAHLDKRNPVLLNVQAGYRFYSYPNIGWQLAGGYCQQLISTDNKSRNRSTYIASAQFFRPVGDMGEWFISSSYTPGYFVVGIGMRGIIQ